MLSLQIVGDQAAADRLRRLPPVVRRALVAKITELTIRLENHVKQDKLSGQVLHTVTGRLKRSIQHRVVDSGDKITGVVYSDGTAKYAGIQEFGGITRPHIIVPVKAQALHFLYQGKEVFARIVHHPGSKMPERSYLRSALADMSDEISSEVRSATEGALR